MVPDEDMIPLSSASALWDRIVLDVTRAYGSLSEPTWWFVSREHDRAPYAELLAELSRLAALTDDTDLNDDVGLYLTLTPLRHLRHGADAWSLCLSYAGPYAAFYRHGGPVLTEATPGLLAVESGVLELLRAHGVAPLGEELLARPFPLPGLTHNDNPEEVLLFHVLFGDYEGLPWGWAGDGGS